jgi:hypothetical protein
MRMTLDLDTYGARAERFIGELDREYYLHFAGLKEDFAIEAIYERHAGLFERSAVEGLREIAAAAREGDERRRTTYLLQLGVEGHIGQATKAEAAALAQREAALEIEFDGTREPYRHASIVQANEPDTERRAQIERARLEALEAELNPLYVEVLERSHALARELGWESYRAMYVDLKGIDLEALEQQTRAFNAATAESYKRLVEPQLIAQTGIAFDTLRRSDLPYFFRAPTYDELFPADRLMTSFEHTLAGFGIDLSRQSNVILDLERRPNKSPRAFCSPVRVPEEIFLVVHPRGGRDDYATLFHEGGHAEHFAAVEPGLAFEFRHLGDNSVTECFAFLLEHLTQDRSWLRLVLGMSDVEGYLGYAQASKLVFLRRYAAKLSYELELHDGRSSLTEMPELYSRYLGEATGVDWPAVTYLDDVDEGFYAANYLRAWAFETQLRRFLRDRYGDEWFHVREAGDFLRSLWQQGQRLPADELLAEATGETLDFTVLVGEMERDGA